MAFPTFPSNDDLHTEFGRTFKYSSVSNSWSVATPDAPEDNALTTQGYVDVQSLPLTDVAAGSKAFVQDGNKLFIFTGSGWFEIATINTAPTITAGADATYTLNSDGTPTVITLQATDPEGTPIIWGYQVTSGSLEDTAITNEGGVFTITPGTTPATFDLAFTASDGVNIDTSASSFTLQFAPPPGQVAFTTPGTYSWTAPDGVTSVSVVAVGGGGSGRWGSGAIVGGAGGGLGWKNNISVTPGQSYTVVVGAGGDGWGSGTDSYFINQSTVAGLGGAGGTNRGSFNAGGSYVGDGGGTGGNSGTPLASGGTSTGSGAGGAGGYSGNGGTGKSDNTTGAGGSGSGGGGGGGGAMMLGQGYAGEGGGVGILGQGDNGWGSSYGGAPGSGGVGKLYGGGGGAGSGNFTYTPGGSGAVRIIWGSDRSFPSTNTIDM